MARRKARPFAFRTRDEDVFLSDVLEPPVMFLKPDDGDGGARDAGPGEDGSSAVPLIYGEAGTLRCAGLAVPSFSFDGGKGEGLVRGEGFGEGLADVRAGKPSSSPRPKVGWGRLGRGDRPRESSTGEGPKPAP
jgi:hypothetical protein